ncbi:MAG TPA: glycosyltransferase [bacterium]|nr:glycosyltransferase [bacterium]HPN30632.1 glycosyltransferase [bacterium]
MNPDCLIIAHDFPPFAGGGVMRVHKFVKYLPHYGINPVVLTINDKYYISKDFSLLDEYKESMPVRRTKSIDLKYYYSVLKFKKRKDNTKEIFGVDKKSVSARFFDNLSASILIPDLKVLWLPFCLYNAVKIIRKHNIKKILITSPPHSVQLAGIVLKKIFPDIKIIADFRDLWTDYDVYTYPFKYVKIFEERMERAVLRNSDKIICATKSIAARFSKKYKDISESKFEVITNGFDPEDYEELKKTVSLNSNEKKDYLKIVYSGSLNDWRNLENLICALKKLFDEKKIERNKINITLCGHITERDLTNIEKNKMTDIFAVVPMENHKSSIIRFAGADVTLLIIGALEGNEVLTGKLFEYIGSQKIIFGIVPKNGEAETVIKKYNLGYSANTDSVDEIAERLYEIYEVFFSGKLVFNGDPAATEIFSRKPLAGRLAKIIKEIY